MSGRDSQHIAWPVFGEDEIEAVGRVLRSGKVNYWTGSECREFEREFAAQFGSRHAVAVANGTVAIELALEALGVGAGDEVITTPRTFVASASAAIRRGAQVRFADVDRQSQNITAESVAQVLTRRTKAIVAVHLAGWPCDMDPIMDLARAHGIAVIEDCAQAHGASYKGRPVGSIGHVGTFSFCQDKIMTTGGEGGMVVTNDPEVWARIWSLKDHGKEFELAHRAADPAVYRWLHHSFGSNQRLTEMQAVIGRAQLRKLPGWIASRRRNAAALANVLTRIPGIRVPLPEAHLGHAYYKFYAFLEPEVAKQGLGRDQAIRRLRAAGIACGPGSCPEIYLERAFEGTGMQPPSRLPNARQLGDTSMMFLVDPTQNEQEMVRVGNAVREVMASEAA